MGANQRGVFAIEMAFVLFFIAALLVFTGDIAFKLFNRVALDRASYSLVNIMKERTRFYNKRFELNQQDINDIQVLASRLLTGKRPFGLRVNSLDNGVFKTFDGNISNAPVCRSDDALTPAYISELVPQNLAGKFFPLYQVTLCYQVDSWFDNFFGNQTQSYLQSTSVIVGR
ncbi:tight adherence pilus pseudopilin TadF [Moritella viscosa]|uniref:Membrane associated secretion system protein n=1 Tax=Moritella viscosa TaxID=80854 RepID=A0A1L0A5F7_9GAMM|nr:tight adherence pilus pseudopilin TadF [Moritella viscosa]SGZ08475.1 Putative uncharacterized protein [Moritella viscosa]SHO10484.1 Putative uncharacterized protein [Moritella viscosa]SHO10488.1 Putative uncharacterized protein [Moritella viscosa]SHO15676.1 Putative uncharacterized protein [Moritella viscosa]SHO17477.1 Putative uncharacterized protein [Moritella viscosa]